MRRQAQCILSSPRTLVIGHRGYRDAAPENTLPSFELALAAGADLVEFDCHQSSDGVPVVIHDATLKRTTDAAGVWRGKRMEVARRTAAELRTLDAGAWKHPRFSGSRIPTLEEAVEAIHPGAVPLIERKAGDAATLAAILKRRDWINRAIVIAFDWDFLETLQSEISGQVLGALGPQPGGEAGTCGNLDVRAIERIKNRGIDLIVWNSTVSRAAIAAAHRRGMKVWIYTVNDPAVAERLVRAGADGLISDNPARMWRTLARMR